MKYVTAGLVFLLACAGLIPERATAAEAASTHRAFPVTITDDAGFKIRFDHQPKRILSLDPRDTETLFALGLESRVVGDGSQYSEGAAGITGPGGKPRPFRYPSEWPSKDGRDYPVRALRLPHVEGGYSGNPFNIETIRSVRPDAIFTLRSDLDTLQKMRDLGMKVVILDPASINGIFHDITLVGRVTGATGPAKALAATLKEQLKSLKSRIARAKKRPQVYYELDATNPTQPYTAGPGTFIDDAVHIAGSRNVADSLTNYPGCPGRGCYFAIGVEKIVQLDPQIILLGDAYETPPVTQADVKARGGWDVISAVKTGKVYAFDDELISRAGPRIVIGIAAMARLVHPELFKKKSLLL